jgi:hypothetical protein
LPKALLDRVRQKMAANLDEIQRHEDFQRNVLKRKNPLPYVPNELEVHRRALEIFRRLEFRRILASIVAQRPAELQQEIDELRKKGNGREYAIRLPDDARLVELCQQRCAELEKVLGGRISFGAGQGRAKNYELLRLIAYEWQIASERATGRAQRRCRAVSPPAVS